jgi:hypothetical protein
LIVEICKSESGESRGQSCFSERVSRVYARNVYAHRARKALRQRPISGFLGTRSSQRGRKENTEDGAVQQGDRRAHPSPLCTAREVPGAAQGPQRDLCSGKLAGLEQNERVDRHPPRYHSSQHSPLPHIPYSVSSLLLPSLYVKCSVCWGLGSLMILQVVLK